MSNAEPNFTGGGSVFGWVVAQWRTFLGSKVDASNGTSTNQNLIDPTINGLPIPDSLITSADAPLAISVSTVELNYNSTYFATDSSALDLATQGANLILAGPTTGSAAKPTFRALVNADLPGSVSGAPTGSMLMFGGTTSPSGWLNCDSSAVSRTTYATLFAVIGTTFGVGDGITTFNLPDSRGRVFVGYDAGNSTGRMTQAEAQGISAAAIGNAGGEQGHTLTNAELASHSHGITDPQHYHGPQGTWNMGGADGDSDNTPNSPGTIVNQNSGTATTSSSTGITINADGGGGAHNNVQPGIVVNFIIKT